jgi:hypothetical protein
MEKSSTNNSLCAKPNNTLEGNFHCCAHRVKFWYDVGQYELTEDQKQLLTEAANDRARHCINEDYVSGQLVCFIPELAEEFFGWWDIDKS